MLNLCKAAGDKVQSWSKVSRRITKEIRKKEAGGAHTAGDLRDRRPTPKNEIAHLLSVSVFVLFFFFFRRNSQTDYMNKRIQKSKSPHTLFLEG